MSEINPEYEAALSALWGRVRLAINSERDIYQAHTEQRLGTISNRALCRVVGWPDQLTSFIWRKVGDGVLREADAKTLEVEIDQVAKMVELRSFEEAQAAQRT